MPAVQRVLESALYVGDVERSERFYRDLFGFRSLLVTDRLRALDVGDRQVLLLFARGASKVGEQTPAGLIPGHDGSGTQHVAFAIAPAEVEAWAEILAQRRVEVISRAQWPQGGESLYFRDPDGHLVELATPSIWGFTT